MAVSRTGHARAGSSYVLTTKVLRRTDKQPLAGYRVRYRILNGPPAVFLPGRTAEVEATSDLNGNAHAALVLQGPAAGVNHIGMEIIRPPDPTVPSGTGLTLARGETTVAWQAPIVTLDLNVPPTVVLGQELPYTITIKNAGQVAAHAFTVRQNFPESVTFARADLPPSVEGRQLVWTLGELAAGQARTIQTVFRTTKLGPVTSQVVVDTGEGLRGEKTATTEVTPQPQPLLKLNVTGPATALLNAPVTLQVVVNNPGTGPARNIVLTGNLDAGLEHESKANPVVAPISSLGPGESRSVPLTLTARQSGPQSIHLTVTADGGLKDVGQHTFTVQHVALKLNTTGPSWRYAGQAVSWSVEVANTGEVALKNVVVRDTLPPELTFKSAGEGGTFDGRQVVWTIEQLPVGEKKSLPLTTVGQQLTPRALAVTTATAEPGLQVQAETPIEIRGLPALRMRVVDQDDPVVVGNRTIYHVDVTNQGSLPARDVVIDAVVPDEMRVVDARGPAPGKIEGQHVTFPVIASLATGAALNYQIEVEARKAGTVYFRAELKAGTLSQPVVEEESTIIMAAPGTGATPANSKTTSPAGGGA